MRMLWGVISVVVRGEKNALDVILLRCLGREVRRGGVPGECYRKLEPSLRVVELGPVGDSSPLEAWGELGGMLFKAVFPPLRNMRKQLTAERLTWRTAPTPCRSQSRMSRGGMLLTHSASKDVQGLSGSGL